MLLTFLSDGIVGVSQEHTCAPARVLLHPSGGIPLPAGRHRCAPSGAAGAGRQGLRPAASAEAYRATLFTGFSGLEGAYVVQRDLHKTLARGRCLPKLCAG